METPPSTFASRLRDALSADEAPAPQSPSDAAPARRPARGRRPAAAARSFPVTVTQMPTVRCQVCGSTVAHRKGEVSAVLTAHYEREHADLLG